MLNKNKVIKAVATVTVFSVITRTLSFIFKIYLSRELGAEAVGLYQISLSIFYLFASLSASGIPLVLSRRTAEARAVKRDDDCLDIFSSALIMGVAIAFSTLLVLYFTKDKLGILLSDKRALPLLIIMLPALLSTTIYSVIRSWFWGRKEFASFSITETIEEVFRILFSVLFVSGLISGISGKMGIALAFTVSDMLVAIILMIMFFCKGGKIKKPKDFKEIFMPSLPVSLMRIYSSLIGTFIALILPLQLIRFGSTVGEATAIFGRISGMANPLIMAPNAIISSLIIVLIPEMSENNVTKNFSALNKNINMGINFSLLICGVFLTMFFALGEELTVFLYADNIAGEYLKVASFLMLPMAINQICQSSLNSVGLEKEAFINYILGSLSTVFCVYFFTKYIGFYSVAVASMCSMVISSALNINTLHKKTDYKPQFVKVLAMVVITMLPSAFMAKAVYGIIANFSTVLGTIIGIAVAMVSFVTLIFVTGVVDIDLIKRKGVKALN